MRRARRTSAALIPARDPARAGNTDEIPREPNRHWHLRLRGSCRSAESATRITARDARLDGAGHSANKKPRCIGRGFLASRATRSRCRVSRPHLGDLAPQSYDADPNSRCVRQLAVYCDSALQEVGTVLPFTSAADEDEVQDVPWVEIDLGRAAEGRGRQGGAGKCY